jgi:uncharacterized protein (TIGR02246 family)
MSRNVVVTVAIGLMAAAITGFIFAQEGPKSGADSGSGRPKDEAAIREASRALAQAFEKGDARAVAEFWTEEGEYMDEGGEPVHGRAALEKAYAGFFAKRPELKAESTTRSVRFLGADTAIEEGTFTVSAKDGPADSSRYSSLYVREGGRWRIAMLKEWSDDTSSPPSLDDLAWLIGTWESEGEGPKAHVTYEWSETRAFIRSKFVIAPNGEQIPTTAGTQVIGVDRAEGTIRAWTFDPDGGFGEATWTRDGDRWSIDSKGTLADGSLTTATNFLAPAGKDAFTWRSVQRKLGGEDLPDLGPVKVYRVREAK